MWLQLCSLALSMPLSSMGISTDEACAAAQDVRTVILESAASLDDHDALLRKARLLLVTGWIESRWRPAVAGPYIGVAQVDRYVWAHLLTPKRIELVSTTRIEGFRLGLEVLDSLTVSCGSLRKAVYAYISGRCDGRSDAIRAKADMRCFLAGGC